MTEPGAIDQRMAASMESDETGHDPAGTAGIARQVADARAVFTSGVTRPLGWRLEQLKAMNAMLVEHQDDFAAALAVDLGKHPSESWLTEIGFLTAEISHTIKHLAQWLAPRKSAMPVAMQPGKAFVVLDPLGVVLVIAPWNYPIQLLLAPVIGALAAGNTVVAKPSELAPASSAALARWVPEYLGGSVTIVEGGVPETTALLAERFDHIVYTGNGRVGRIGMAAAAKNLTPVTLELGGKSPVYIDDTVNIRTAAQRIAWGKYINAGQTCVAPDYVLGTAGALAKLADALPEAIRSLYGDEPQRSAEYGRIINAGAHARVSGLLAADLADRGNGSLVTGGEADADSRYIAPTVLHVDAGAALMQEEIFGPVLPLVTVTSADEAIDFINERDKPLALYVFSEDEGVRAAFTERTSSGGLAFGVPVAHLTVPGLPFGGVGASGMGGYHGKYSIDTFSHHKAVMDKPLSPDTLAMIYPPFGAIKRQVIKRLVAPTKKFSRG